MLVTAHIEAMGYGSTEEEGLALMEALGGVEELSPSVSVDVDRGMVMVAFSFDAADAVEAHGEALDVWRAAWEQAFSELAPTSTLAVTIRPAEGDEAGPVARVAAGVEDDEEDWSDLDDAETRGGGW